ncbi:hypothetical protein [Microbispora sp. NBC_01389]
MFKLSDSTGFRRSAVGAAVLRMGDARWASYYPSADPGVTTPDSYANTTA